MIRRRTLLAAILGSGVSVTMAGAVSAESYPTRPIKFVVPFLAGGTVDIVARVIGQQMSARARAARGDRQSAGRRHHHRA